jgi:hypothetical protein
LPPNKADSQCEAQLKRALGELIFSPLETKIYCMHALVRTAVSKEAKPYQVRDARNFLEQAGVKP